MIWLASSIIVHRSLNTSSLVFHKQVNLKGNALDNQNNFWFICFHVETYQIIEILKYY